MDSVTQVSDYRETCVHFRACLFPRLLYICTDDCSAVPDPQYHRKCKSSMMLDRHGRKKLVDGHWTSTPAEAHGATLPHTSTTAIISNSYQNETTPTASNDQWKLTIKKLEAGHLSHPEFDGYPNPTSSLNPANARHR